MFLRTGDIVCVKYSGFDGKERNGIFLIVYSERQDRVYTNGHTNINCVKITTNNLLGNGYTVRLRAGDGNVNEDCIVNLSKQHTFLKEQVIKKIGTLTGNTMFNIFKELRAFNNEVEQQIMENI